MHELRRTFYARHFVFNLRTNFNRYIIFFCTTLFNRCRFWAANKLEFFRRFQQDIILPSCIIPRDQLKFNSTKRTIESSTLATVVNTVALERLVLNSLFPLIETLLLMAVYVFYLGKTFQLLKFSLTYSVKDSKVYGYFFRNYDHFVNHDWQQFFSPIICEKAKKVLP